MFGSWKLFVFTIVHLAFRLQVLKVDIMSYIRQNYGGRGRGVPKDAGGHKSENEKIRTPGGLSADKRFAEASKLHTESVERHLSKQQKNTSPSSGDTKDDVSDELMKKITATYVQHDTEGSELIDTHSIFDTVLNEDTNVCLICLESIERAEPIWNCPSCYCIIHITCIQQWIREGAYQQKLDVLSEQHFPNKKVPWHCPKCRTEYPHSEFPTVYKCYCGKTNNPSDDPWQLPHSCGETCHRPLKPHCGHQCLLLCHPGPCPHCPKSVKVACYCGQQAPVSRRCGSKNWSCGKRCPKVLACGQHRCSGLCHQGECKPCPETSTQSCACRREKTTRPCAQPSWSCNTICGMRLSCGNHYCNKKCHRKGECGPCERSAQTRYCPCGKTSAHNLPCTEEVACCGDTCGKPLACGKHMCTEKCHTDSCSQCFQVSVKSCRCGVKQRELPCAKPFTCDTKCQNMKSCGRHACKRRCCDGTSCSECDQFCGKKLKCGNHKCASICHEGPCYPCTVTIEKSCNCGRTKISVPCIRQKTAQSPRCRQPCLKKPSCDHPAIQKHSCHFGSCPSCLLVCHKQLPECSHTCDTRCHDAVHVKVQLEKKVLSGPWEQQAPTYNVVERQACPPCTYPCTVSCKGGHESSTLPCSRAIVYSCNRVCGQPLQCTNHCCSKECHVLSTDKVSGIDCERCERDCSQVRVEGCTHPCLKPCHPCKCPPCKQAIKTRCHCAVTVLYIPCFEWTSETFNKNERLCCPGLCPKELSCGHPCSLPCHPPGRCQLKCTKKVVLRCRCKTIRQSVVCHLAADTRVECSDKCRQREIADQGADQTSQTETSDQDVDAGMMLPGRRQRKRKERQVLESTTRHSVPWKAIQKYGLVAGIVLAVVAAFYVAITSED